VLGHQLKFWHVMIIPMQIQTAMNPPDAGISVELIYLTASGDN
jgi:hypothetical protein